ncbi:MAG: two-component system phosphate regulon sensor histidine kinase PhoR [Arenicella sp.]|jgi:two-component system phosphate regulon sensor histidine kinase PhoR
MSLALIGIIVIQYRWIDNTITEKQKLIDNNVMLAVSNVEQRLNDHRAMTFMSSFELGDFEFNEIITDIDTAVSFQEIRVDSAPNVEIKVLSSFQHHSDDHQIIIQNNNHQIIEFDSDSLSITDWVDELDQIESLVNRMKIEIHTGEHDLRLDSGKVRDVLKEELAANDLGEILDWGIFDNEDAVYKIHPKHPHMTDYDIPLFTTDVMAPGRYDLRLNLDKSDFLWREIWGMIVLSLVSILIIMLVFAHSIKLVIKHKKISQIKSDFINNMTHEFKTPLATISLAADSLLHPNTNVNQDSLEKYVGIIQDEKTKLNSHVERILEVASLNKDALAISVNEVNITEAIQSSLSKLKLMIEKYGSNIQTDLRATKMAKANIFHLENVFVNLIENGIKYSDEPAQIKISSQEVGDEILISISDKGIGMEAKQLSKVFDNFYRVQSGNVHDTKGFGLGLSYSKLVIEKMEGSIELSSTVGQGTTAIIKLKKS